MKLGHSKASCGFFAPGSTKDAGVFFKMGDENPVTLLGDLSKPATVLIEKVSDAVGGLFRPHQIVRVA